MLWRLIDWHAPVCGLIPATEILLAIVGARNGLALEVLVLEGLQVLVLEGLKVLVLEGLKVLILEVVTRTGADHG